MKLIKFPLRDSVYQWLVSNYGERCQEVEEECICCKKWIAFDSLFNDDEYTPTLVISIGPLENEMITL